MESPEYEYINYFQNIGKGSKGMTVINLVLASGVGSRLYPLSTEERPKQFLNLISDKPMIEETLTRFKPFVNKAYVVTLMKYMNYVENLDATVVYEPERKESAVSVLNGLWAIAERFDYADDVIILQTPSDHYIENDSRFSLAIQRAIRMARKNKIVMVGVEPFNPSEDFGYIRDGCPMIEKPSKEEAEGLIKKGYYWNTAIYAYPLRKMLGLFELFMDKEGESFERTVLLKASEWLRVIPSDFVWEDIGSLDRLFAIERYIRSRGEDKRGEN